MDNCKLTMQVLRVKSTFIKMKFCLVSYIRDVPLLDLRASIYIFNEDNVNLHMFMMILF
jgi:hypothetical protein